MGRNFQDAYLRISTELGFLLLYAIDLDHALCIQQAFP